MKLKPRRLIVPMAIALFSNCPTFAGDTQPIRLTLQQAQQIAITNHPRITEAQLIALATRQVVQESRSAFFPVLGGRYKYQRADL